MRVFINVSHESEISKMFLDSDNPLLFQLKVHTHNRKEKIIIVIFILTPLVEEQVEEVLSKELQGSQEEVTIC